MAIILSIETSTKGCSAAIHQDTQLVALSELFHEKSSSGMLTSLIQHVAKVSGLDFQAIDAVAVAKGPGSYTGLRIGVSTAKGLCFTLDKPLLAVNTLRGLAWQVHKIAQLVSGNEIPLLCPMLDARRMEVYCALYRADTLEQVSSTEARIIDENAFEEILETQKIIFFGDGAAKCKDVLGKYSNAVFLEQTINPSARSIGVLAHEAYQQSQFENVADFEPYYLKEFMTTTPKKN
ncbi:tRNA (adenosine(37)-N6)-threonylcarbamoyltransferase complex dimerization subunit type 1 TsaB [Emticicia sp. BO119]|uniref:tRNA (adenosine(37)-N6)-threonylcarbamoyltransferase complex dimerization subunit type 1 TsaB n=1 Tax=Emticicia sp. BO119 TaxID=2757768 RepID=UPI0015EFFFBA|nr:tRNA (adenosine(37)-N6)-threonylcarbamoyltransferase complex dimerization subunit type 1 TsaB [Emticicia sp. BO119]MBA4848786.1 tRNA (adenosine(37)-N6)-threonylcarbamoyltransferase complex dimerization subunit type 1 TsaB [Emticicia sp. BO119]